MEDEQQLSRSRYRVYPIIGIVLGLVFLGLGAGAFLAGGGPIVGTIALVGGVLVLVVSIINLVRA
ncbi:MULTISPECIES: hypothetical protein [unclassified Microbacterium]|uniref:hypothetical protein n=1 Tax=unclassified Microbacterium TaxID=2609290 RepID=UPI0037453C7A